MKLFNIETITAYQKNAPEPGGVGGGTTGTTGAETVRIPVVLETYINDLITQVSGRYREGAGFQLVRESDDIKAEYQALVSVESSVSSKSEFTIQEAQYIKTVIERFEAAVVDADVKVINPFTRDDVVIIADKAEAALQGAIDSFNANQESDPDANDPRGDQIGGNQPNTGDDALAGGSADDPIANPDALPTTPGTPDDPIANLPAIESQAGTADDEVANLEAPDLAGTADDAFANPEAPDLAGTADDAVANPVTPNNSAGGTSNNTGGNTSAGNSGGGNSGGGIDTNQITDALKELLGGATESLPETIQDQIDGAIEDAIGGAQDQAEQAAQDAIDNATQGQDGQSTQDSGSQLAESGSNQESETAETAIEQPEETAQDLLEDSSDGNVDEVVAAEESEEPELEIVDNSPPGAVPENDLEEVDASYNQQIISYVEENEPDAFQDIDTQVRSLMEVVRFAGDMSIEEIYESIFVSTLKTTEPEIYEAAVEAVTESNAEETEEPELEIVNNSLPKAVPENDLEEVDAFYNQQIISYVEVNEAEVFDTIDAQVRSFMARALFAAGTDLQEVYETNFVARLQGFEPEIYEAAVKAVVDNVKETEIERIDVLAPGLVPNTTGEEESLDLAINPDAEPVTPSLLPVGEPPVFEINPDAAPSAPDIRPIESANESDALESFGAHVVDQVETLLPELHDKLSMLVQEAYGQIDGAEFNAAFTNMAQEYYGHVYDQIAQGYDGEMPGADAVAAMEHDMQDMLDDGSDNLDELVGSEESEPAMVRDVSQDEVAQNVEVQVITNDDDLAAAIGQDII